MSPKVFISHSSADVDQARQLAGMLRARGLNSFLPEENIRWGDNIYDKLSKAIDESDLIVLFISSYARHSPSCRREWSEALTASWQDPRKQLYPILVEGADLPSFLSNYQVVRTAGNADLEALADLIKRAALAGTKDRLQNSEITWPVGWSFKSNLVHQLSFSPDGTRLITAGDDGTARLWDVPGVTLHATIKAQSSPVRCVAFSPDARLAAFGADDGEVRLLDVPEGILVATMESGFQKVWAVAFSSDGRAIAAAGDASEIHVWDPATRALKSSMHGHSMGVHCIAFSPDSRLIATGGDDGSVRIWDALTGTVRSAFGNDYSPILSLAFSPDARMLAYAGASNDVGLRDVSTGSLHSTLRCQDGIIRSVAFAPDGRLVAAGSGHVAQVWDPATGEEVATLHHDSVVRSIDFSPDGLYLCTCDNSAVRAWEIPSTLARRRLSEIEADAQTLRPSQEDLGQRRATLTWLLANKRQALGPDDPSVASTLVNLAVVAREQGDLSEAYSLLREALDAQRRILGPDHPSVASTLVNLAAVAQQRGDLSEAYSLLLEAIETSKFSRSESRTDGLDWETISAKAQQLFQELNSDMGNAGRKP